MEVHRLVFSPIEVNTYIIAEDTDCAIIDCGCFDESEFRMFRQFLDEKHLNPVLLLNTHCHLDHVFGNKFMLRDYNLRSFSHELEEKNRLNSVKHAMMFGLSMDEPPEPAGFLADNQKMTFASNEFKVLHVPGHSPGGVAFYFEKEGCVFTGDALFQGSIGRTDLPGGSSAALLNSIKTKLFTLPPGTAVYPGHGGKTDIKTEMRYNPFFS